MFFGPTNAFKNMKFENIQNLTLITGLKVPSLKWKRVDTLLPGFCHFREFRAAEWTLTPQLRLQVFQRSKSLGFSNIGNYFVASQSASHTHSQTHPRRAPDAPNTLHSQVTVISPSVRTKFVFVPLSFELEFALDLWPVSKAWRSSPFHPRTKFGSRIGSLLASAVLYSLLAPPFLLVHPPPNVFGNELNIMLLHTPNSAVSEIHETIHSVAQRFSNCFA